MEIVLSDLIIALSVALDFVEKQLLGISDHHAQRIAYLSYMTGTELGLSKPQCTAIAEAAILHDNALKEFVEDETVTYPDGKTVPRHDEQFMTKHCFSGEENVKKLPFYPLIDGAVLYHHECADGSGAFGKTYGEIPLAARIIHIADVTDAMWNFADITDSKSKEALLWVKSNENKKFDSECMNAFLRVCGSGKLKNISDDSISGLLKKTFDEKPVEIKTRVLFPIAEIFAKITDYKSHFTCAHSLGIAEKARKMAEYYGYDEETQDKLYFAGALHDIGKLMINNDILEKPGRLTQTEYTDMKDHALATYNILSHVRGIEDITLWASLHHEKLDGSGYPFGKKSR